MSMVDIVRSHLCVTLPYPTKEFTGQTVIVTGSSSGMGREAARHFVRLGAARVILAVRNLPKGRAVASDIADTTKRPEALEVWELELESYDSVKRFAERARGLDRLDVVVANAAIYTWDFEMAGQDEKTITVNVVNTLLLGVLLLPKLRETSVKMDKEVVLTFTGSFTHFYPKLRERNADSIFQELNGKDKADMSDRYYTSKLIQLLLARELADQVTASKKPGRIIVSTLNPGFVDTDIMRESSKMYALYVKTMKKVLSRTAEEGGRILVNAAEGGQETHGQYLDDCKVGKVSPFVASKEGADTQARLWKELAAKLQKIQPGVMENI